MDLSFAGLGVTLAGRPVLAGIDATLRAGRVTAIIGPNGAGKSTLVKAAAALVPLAAGSVRIGDEDVAALDPRERARRIAYLPQLPVVHWNVTAREVIALGRWADRSPSDHPAIGRAVAAAGVETLLDRPLQELSGGERARVLFARVLAGEPRWLLADEPLASLDPGHALDLLDRLRAVAANGSGVAVVLHDLVQAARVADDVLLLAGGRVAAFGPADAVLVPTVLGPVYGVGFAMLGRAPVPTGRLDPA